MSTQPISVNMLIVMANDLEKMIDYYKKLGLELVFQVPNKWAEFDIHGVKFGIAQTNYELPERRTGIVLEVPKLYDFYSAAKTAGIEFLSEPTQAVHGIMVSFKDPGNNILDLYQPTPEHVKELIKKAQEEHCKKDDSCECKSTQKTCCGHKH